MTEQDRSFVIRLFAMVIAGVFVFIIVSMVGGFITARMMGLPVDTERFYATIGPPFTMMLGAILGFLAGGGKKEGPNEP